MPPAPSSDPDPDAPEPAGSGQQPVPAGGNDGHPQTPQTPQTPEPPWSGDEEEAADYLGELMAAVVGGEELTAEDICGAGFGQDGTAEQMHPGPVLAALVHAATTDEKILATLPDDDLMGVIAAVRRIGSFAAWAEMTAVREFATRPDPRRPAAPGAAPGAASGAASGAAAGGRGAARGIDGRDPNAAVAGLPGRPTVREFAAEELALDLHLSWQSAAGQIAYACTVAARLPRTFAALRAGQIHPVHVRIIEDETAFLSDQDAAAADEELAEAARSKTFGELRYHAHRLVLKLDPESALRRKEAARKDAHVRAFREGSGNAGMVARELPSDEVLASWQHVDQRARDLRAAGVPGTLQELRVRAYLDLLQERDTRTVPASPDASSDPDAGDPDASTADASAADASTADGGGSDASTTDGSGSDGPDDPGGNGGNGGTGPGPRGGPAGTGPGGNARQPRHGSGPSLSAQVTLTIPWATQQGGSAPGEAGGFGLLDPETARDLAAAAARHPDTRWCYTALHPDGTAAAHACAPGPHPGGPPDPRTLKFNTVIRGPCNHAQAQAGYRPGRKLRHLVAARNATCTAPGCGQPAARCDLDHTSPWHLGGLTCPCNISPLCRHHHRVKQAQGWWLTQPEPGVLRWKTPAGRTHTTTPTQYPTD
jgi:hypothetical protein